jgi:hypothetical protein
MTRRPLVPLPPLTTEQLVVLTELLHDLATAIWAAHQPELGEYAMRARAAERGATEAGSSQADDDLPF